MKTVSIQEAASDLQTLLAALAEGESVVIARDGAPVARLVAYEPVRRTPGALRQEPGWENFVYDPSIFAPMTDDEMAEEGWPV